ncbi:MAG: hypothetical protein IIA61_07650 [Candidatus Marinimicrobia bacterium]|nr:hypothetical protein [Candidatus Neomarinimicrobiota bacterium]
MLKPIDKALLLRKSKHLRSKEPLQAFGRRMNSPRKILNIIESSNNSNRIKLEARRQYIVSLITAFEIFWREHIRITIDSYQLTEKHLSKIRSHKFSFGDLHAVLGKNLTVGELLTSAYSFQSRMGIERLINDLFDVNLYSELRSGKLKVVITLVDDPELKENVVKMDFLLNGAIPALDKCVAIRNSTVHDTGTIYRPSENSLRQYESWIGMYNLFVGVGVEGVFQKYCKAL